MNKRGLFNKERAAARWEPLRDRLIEAYAKPGASLEDVGREFGASGTC